MKIVFIVGFYRPVKQLVDEKFADRLAEGSIIWISDANGYAADLEKFKSRLFDVLASKAPAEMLVLYAVPPDQLWLDGQLARLLGQARNRFPSTPIGFDIFGDANSPTRLEARIVAFRLPPRANPSMLKFEAKMNGTRAICVSALGHTSVRDALVRTGFEQATVDQYVDEEIVPIGKNSMLNDRLINLAQTYAHMLYAWDGLRSSSNGVVQAFKKKGKFFEASSAAKVAELFKRWIDS